MAELKRVASVAVDDCRDALQQLSDELWRQPELGFKEHKAHDLLTSFLERKGFAVERGYTGIETAFRATFGSGRPNVCVICEYDALPEIGHACGHNLIAEAGVAAGLGVKAALESSGAPKGRVTIMGTPAEEGGSGKVRLIENEAFKDIDTAMMIHPTPVTLVAPGFLAVCQFIVTFTGKAAHAAAFPWEGVNALDAAVMAYNSISVLRQQMKPDWRVHGVITNGGTKPNIIPEKTELEYWVRAPTALELVTLKKKVVACFETAAKATGCQVDITVEGTDLEINSNPVLTTLFTNNLKAIGVKEFQEEGLLTGSTDMGSVSYMLPALHPTYKIGSGAEVNHTREFTSIANTPDAHRETLVFAKVMAHTCIDVLMQPESLETAKRDFQSSIAKLGFEPLPFLQGKLEL